MSHYMRLLGICLTTIIIIPLYLILNPLGLKNSINENTAFKYKPLTAFDGLRISLIPVLNEADKTKLYIKNQLSISNYNCLNTLVIKESNWNFNAVNGSHYGFMQGRSDYLKTASPIEQYDWSAGYVSNRYGLTRYAEPDYCAALDHWKAKLWH